MNWFSVSIFVNLLIFSIMSIQLTSSASFPNPPQRPPPNAPPDEQAHFWRSLHNYYAIIARPRFGKRSGSSTFHRKHPSFVALVDRDSMPSSSSENAMDHMLNEYIPNNNDQRIALDNIYTIGYPDRKRR